ncbi:hypothetical protein MRB53_042317 [Persea americana]|nr:hypothetical protein MRB53_042317 [Persea americana]
MFCFMISVKPPIVMLTMLVTSSLAAGAFGGASNIDNWYNDDTGNNKPGQTCASFKANNNPISSNGTSIKLASTLELQALSRSDTSRSSFGSNFFIYRRIQSSVAFSSSSLFFKTIFDLIPLSCYYFGDERLTTEHRRLLRQQRV